MYKAMLAADNQRVAPVTDDKSKYENEEDEVDLDFEAICSKCNEPH